MGLDARTLSKIQDGIGKQYKTDDLVKKVLKLSYVTIKYFYLYKIMFTYAEMLLFLLF